MSRYCYVNRWFDEDGIPHYFGVYSDQPTLELARKHITFSVLAVELDLVYQAVDEADMFDYLADVNRNSEGPNDESMGTTDWLL